MTILAIDTCFDGCSAAVLHAEDGDAFAAAESFQILGQGHAERLMPMIGEAMRAAHADFATLARIGVTVGPGTFTGTRIGIAAARGLALATGARLVGVSSLLAVGWRALQDHADLPANAAILVCMDARRGQVYAQLIGQDGTAIGEPLLLTATDAATQFAAQAHLLAGTGADAVVKARADLGMPAVGVLPDVSVANLAGAILPRIAHLPDATEPLRPLYLRPPDATPQAGAALARQPG